MDASNKISRPTIPYSKSFYSRLHGGSDNTATANDYGDALASHSCHFPILKTEDHNPYYDQN